LFLYPGGFKKGVGVAKMLISGIFCGIGGCELAKMLSTEKLGLFGGVGVPFLPPPQPEKGGVGGRQ